MDSLLTDYYSNWMTGLKTMTYLHNSIVSILLYMARQSNMSNVLKIIFNFSGLLHQLFTFGLNMLPLEIPISMCRGVAYSQSVSNFFLKETLAIFLLWRLRQIEHRESDKWISLFLFFARTIAQFAQIVLSSPTITFIDGVSVCVPVNFVGARIFVWIVIACDFLIDIYVTTRLVRVLRRANRNAAQISSNIERKTKRTLFTAVMYWNFLRLAIAFVISVLSSLYFEFFPVSNYTQQAVDLGIFGGFNIIMSYVVTVDAEIVRVIEGKPKKGSDSSEKSISGMSYKQQSSLSSHTPPKYSSSKQEEDDVVVSMTRLSFFEWANMVVGFRRDKNNNEREFNEEDIKEIIEGSSNDLERGSSQDNNNKRRSSNLSDGTTVSVEKR